MKYSRPTQIHLQAFFIPWFGARLRNHYGARRNLSVGNAEPEDSQPSFLDSGLRRYDELSFMPY